MVNAQADAHIAALRPTRPAETVRESRSRRSAPATINLLGLKLARMQEEASPARSHALDGLRGYAALAVVFFHAILHEADLAVRVLGQPLQGMASARDVVTKLAIILVNGNVAVTLFFVLSGCVLSMALNRRSDEPVAAMAIDFGISRVMRLYPAIIACMLLFFALSRAGLPNFPAFTLEHLILNSTLLAVPMHGPSGTLQIEMLAVPVVFFVYLLRRRFGPIVYLFAVPYSALAFEAPLLTFNVHHMHLYSLAFMVGMLAAEPSLRPIMQKVPARIWWWFLAFVVFARALHSPATVGSQIVQMCVCGVLVAGLLHGHRSSLHRALESPISQVLGRLSFSLYLLNVPVLFVLWSKTPNWQWAKTHPLEAGLVIGLVTTIVSLPLAWLSERYIERPGIRIGRALTAGLRRQRTQGPIVTAR